MRSIAYIALGSNLGDRERAVLMAARTLTAAEVGSGLRLSSLYHSAAVGMPDAPAFVNAVAELSTLLTPFDLLERLQAIEAHMGRSGGHNRSREIDLDLIACGDVVASDGRLVLPHPRFHERGFVLVPLREVAPAFVCPRTRRPIDELVAALPPSAAVARISGRSLAVRG